jgi:hypothetical protein
MYADWDNPPDWFQMPAPIGDSDPSIITKPCNRSSPEFSILVDPPTNVADCFQVQINMIGRFAFVLDNAGAVWKWGHHPGFLDTQFEIITFPFAGSMVGGAIGLAIAFFIGATRRKDAQAMDGLVL